MSRMAVFQAIATADFANPFNEKKARCDIA
jgi:hypothetical protein